MKRGTFFISFNLVSICKIIWQHSRRCHYFGYITSIFIYLINRLLYSNINHTWPYELSLDDSSSVSFPKHSFQLLVDRLDALLYRASFPVSTTNSFIISSCFIVFFRWCCLLTLAECAAINRYVCTSVFVPQVPYLCPCSGGPCSVVYPP